MARQMQPQNTRAGGFFLMAAILIGFSWGVAQGEPTKGVLIGIGVGVAMALAIWLVDRGRR